MTKEIHELISARKAKEDVLYIYQGTVYAYGKLKNLKHKERFREICSADNYEEKLADDIQAGWKIEIIKDGE